MTFVSPNDSKTDAPPVDLALAEIAPGTVTQSGRVGDFVLFSAAQCVSSIGSWMQKTAFGWLTWELTHSVTWVGAMGVADLVTLLWVAPLAGSLTDRSNPFRLLSATQTALLALSAALCACIASGHLSIWTLWLFAMCDSTLQGFNQPVRMTAINLLAGPDRISQAVATNSIAMNVARSVGPMIAGILIATWGAAPVLACDAVSFLAMLAGIWWLRDRLDRPGTAMKARLSVAIVGGFSAVLRDRLVSPVLLVAGSFALLARPFFDMLPAFAGTVFDGDPHILASMLSAQGLGALGGAMLMLRRHHDVGLARIAATAGVALAITILLFAATNHLALALLLMVAAGSSHVMSNIAMQSLLQLRAPAAVRGQALSLYSLLFRTGPSLGALVIGLAAARWGLNYVTGVSAIGAGLLIFACGRNLVPAKDAGARACRS